jgi:anti-sigma regulatory factor (Ser/Thr protein kinase)
MAPSAARASDATEDLTGQDLASMAGAAVLGSLTLPGRPERVREAREFVSKALGDLHPLSDTAVLLTSELVTNAVVHSNSRHHGGSVSLVIMESGAGIRIEVSDAGSDLYSPVVKADVYASDGHGLFLVQTLSDQWGYLRDRARTTVWFWLAASATACRQNAD